MITLSINDQTITVKNKTTLLKAAKNMGVFIPTICDLPGYPVRSVCRLCLVEQKGEKKLLPACSTIAQEGMTIYTDSDIVIKNRKIMMEFILAEHGKCHREKCELKQLGEQLGVHATRFATPPNLEKQNVSSEYLEINAHSCIYCDRCIRICQTKKVMSRAGKGSLISIVFDDNRSVDASSCIHCRDCVEICPTGAIHYKLSPKFLE